MAQKTNKKTSSALWGFSMQSLLQRHLKASAGSGARTALVRVQAGKKGPVERRLESADRLEIFLAPLAANELETDPRLKTSPAVRMRDAIGASLGLLEKAEVQWVQYDFQLDNELLEAALLGLELALYRFKRVFKGDTAKIGIALQNKGKPVAQSAFDAATSAGVAVNLARHLVNLPPNLLNPVNYADALSKLLAPLPNVKIEVWREDRLRKEKMNLHYAVGVGSATPPRLVHFSYRPPGVKRPPIALVGKGITFDSGGLDIKPAAGMRLMKKDMGGSAAVAGVLMWAARTRLKCALDVYLPLAENSIGGRAFRPSDVITARNGLSVEIHNTDAEGRLVLADALDVAVTHKQRPRAVIDVATLTGAVKVGLGSGMAGLFANDGRLAQALATAGQKSGDLTWIMPLYQKYRAQMASTFADMINSPDGFGGAVTAALFLEKFVRDVPWAHFDIYAWKDSGDGAWAEGGGSGQSVLGLAQWLKTQI